MNFSFRVLFPQIQAFALPYMGVTGHHNYVLYGFVNCLLEQNPLEVQSLSLFGVVQLLLVDVDVVPLLSSSATSLHLLSFTMLLSTPSY